MKPVKSSMLNSAEYDGKGKVRVVFKSGGMYEYEGVDPKTWDKFENTFQASDSSGKFFLKNIKNDKFKKVTEEDK